MTQVTIQIPDNELSFFLKLIEKYDYKTIINDFSISQEMKNMLDERRNSSTKEDFIPWDEAKMQLRFKSKHDS